MAELQIPRDLVPKIAQPDATQSDPWILYLKPRIAECMKAKLQITASMKYADSESFTLPSGVKVLFLMFLETDGLGGAVTDEVDDALIEIEGAARPGDAQVLEKVIACLRECVAHSENSKGLLPAINKKVAQRQKKDYTRGLLDATNLNEDVIGKIGDYAATGKVDGGRKRRTKKSKKSAKKTRKSRRKL
jgi:hypothetical protein